MLADCFMPQRQEWCTMKAVGWDNGGHHGSLGLVYVFYLAFNQVKRESDVSDPKSN